MATRSEFKEQLARAARGNVIDRAIDGLIRPFNPVRVARRQQARGASAFIAWGSGYTGARWDRNATKTWLAPNLAADETTLWDLITLRARSRDLIRNNPIATGAVNTVIQNVVGSGLKLQSRPDAEALGMQDEAAAKFARTVEREFRLFADTTDCDINRRLNFYALQDLAFRSALEGGDAFALLPMVKRMNAVYQTCIQLIEAERVANPVGQSDNVNLRAGIAIDDNGTPLSYHVRKFHPFSTAGTTDMSGTTVAAFGTRTGRRNILHLMDPKRPGQTRGVPYLASVIEPLKMLDRYSEAEITAAVISAMFTVFITTPTGDGLLGDANTISGIGEVNAPGANGALGPNDVALGNGSIIDLMPGEKPEFANPMRPNAGFDPFVQAVMRQIGMALSIPFEVLIKHYTASYSAARAAILDAWQFFNNRRAWLAMVFCQPVYETWFEEAVAFGRIQAPGFLADAALRRAYLKAEWVGDAQPTIDPLKEAQAAGERLQIGVSTLADETLSLTGKIWEDQHAQQVRERQKRLADGLEPGASSPSNPAKDAPGQGNENAPDKKDQPEQPDKSETGDENARS
jgi:lambda family phage portal protein